MTKLGPGPEFDKIRRMIEAAGHSRGHIGDDAAVLDVGAGEKLVVSTDTSVEHVHFKRAWMTFEEIGYRATAAALSDLAAMGATPIGVVVAYGVPRGDSDVLEDLARGAGAAAAASETVIVGGDVSSSATVTVTATVLGVTASPLLRSAARPGDAIYVTGSLGGPAIALAALERGEDPPKKARERFVRPTPRIAEAQWLAKRGVKACIDISDGLAGDAGHLAAASNVGLTIMVESIPLFEGTPGFREALASGEEYELCVTSPVELDCEEFEAKFGIPLSRVGIVGDSPAGEVVFGASAGFSTPESFNHFSE